MSTNQILGYAQPICIHIPKPHLRIDITLFRRQSIPLECFFVILNNAFTFEIKKPKVSLSIGITLFR